MAAARIHPDWHLTDQGTLFNRFTMEVRGTTDEECDCLRSIDDGGEPGDREVYDALREEGILTESDDPDSKLSEFERRAEQVDDVTITNVRFHVTEDCNMGCPGCYVRFKYRNDMDFEDADVEKCHRVVDFLREENEGDAFSIHFNGGEPLMRTDLIEETIDYARETCETTECSFSVTTNATVITDELASYLADNDVIVGVSFDGWQELNDESRVYMDGEGSYEDAVEGYRILQDHLEESPRVVVTPQPLNIDELDEVVEHLLAELDPSGVSINTPFHSNGTWEIDGATFAEKMKRITALGGEYGVTVSSPMSQVLKALANERPKLRTLPTADGRMTAVVSVDGRISYHKLTDDEALFPNHLDERSEQLFRKWATFSGYQHETCRDCVALNTCSGPDPFESYLGNGDVDEIRLNEERCKFYREITPWLADRVEAID